MKDTLGLILSLFFISQVVTAEERIKIVSSFPRTGSANLQTTTIVNGIKMALEEVDYKVGNYKIEYLDWDDASPERGAWDPALEAANADKAVSDQDVMVYIGPYNSGAAKISMPKLNQANLAMISPAVTWPGLTKPGKGEANEPRVYRPSGNVTFFRVVPADDIQGEVAAKWAKELGATRVFILHDRELYGKGLSEMFQKNAKALGLSILGIEGIDIKASNYRSLVTKIRSQNPDLVYFGGTTQSNAGQLAKDLRSGGYKGTLLAPDGCFESAFIDSAGAATLEGNTYLTFGGVPANQLTGKGKDFFEAYKVKFKSEPEAYAAYGFESTRVALEAIRRAGKKDRASIVKEMAAIKDFDGLLGKWSFDENGDTTLKTMSGNTVQGGEFKFVRILG